MSEATLLKPKDYKNDVEPIWCPGCGDFGDLVLGVLTVPGGTRAVLAHPEHGFLEIDPGTYQIGRQREYAGEWRMVAD